MSNNNTNVAATPVIDHGALLAEIARLLKANEALAAKKKTPAADRPLEAKLGTWTNKKDGKVHDMVNITGPFRPINLSVNKCRKIVETIEMIKAAIAEYDAKQV